jgi:hypothetical protein
VTAELNLLYLTDLCHHRLPQLPARILPPRRRLEASTALHCPHHLHRHQILRPQNKRIPQESFDEQGVSVGEEIEHPSPPL